MKIPKLLAGLILLVSVSAQAQIATINKLFNKPLTLQHDYHDIANGYTLLELDNQQLKNSQSLAMAPIELTLPFENKEMVLSLSPVKITSPNFSVVAGTANGVNLPVAYKLPSFYQGKIKGTDSSLATISIFDKQLIGIMSDKKSNIVLGAIENRGSATNQYALYRDIDLKVKAAIGCFTDETALGNQPVRAKNSAAGRVASVGQPVEIYFECDYQFYLDKGSNVNNVVNYVLSFFNSVALLYANENIQVQVSQIKVWTTPDPYVALTTTSDVLTSFGNNMNTDPHVGDYAHFLSTRSLGGGIAYLLSDPCNNARGYRSGVSAVFNTYSNFPAYSWTVNVVTHELGHNFGSHHTHWCGWPGGPIDWCGPTANIAYVEGTCTTGPIPPAGGGTIMSYCHLLGSVGINLLNGFGPLPGQAIRTAIGGAACFGTCKMTATNVKVNASCGQNNGSATITPANGTGPYTYLWNNGQTTASLTNVSPGIYNAVVTDAAGCKLTLVDTIVNAGATLPVTLTPSGTASFCSGGSQLLTATNNVAYTYQWFNNNVAIPGATSSTYTATTAANYSVQVVSAGCNVTKSVTLTTVGQPTASITATGPLTFCGGGSLVLNAVPATGYQYQWYQNGTAIAGATTNTYSATTTGNYTVLVYAGTCQSVSAPTAVTVSASPSATITSPDPLTFCSGAQAILNAANANGYSFQWYRNNTLINGATSPTFTATTPGAYTVKSTLGTCSTTSTASTVSVLPRPVVILTPDTANIQKYQMQTLTAAGAASYNWEAQPDIVTYNASTAVVIPLTTTLYKIEGTGANGCKDTASALVIVNGCGEVLSINYTVLSPSRTILRWINPANATDDSIQYRPKGTLTWTSVYSPFNEYTLNGLTPGTDYEYRIFALCIPTKPYVPSELREFTTPALNGGLYLKLFPNPIQQNTTLEIILNDPYTLQVDLYAATGQKIMSVSPLENLPAGQKLVPMNGLQLPSGIYYLSARINGAVHIVKMLVQR